MKATIGIRGEDINRWEGRAPLVPADIENLIRHHDLSFVVQPSELRAIPADEYERAGALINDDLSACSVVLAVKEIPLHLIQREKTYVFFSHVIKGQEHNMPMLQRLMELGCTLIDYEKMVDASGRRLIFFGRFAGAAGMVDTLWAVGQRLKWEGCDTPFSGILPAHHYRTTDNAKQALSELASPLAQGLPEVICPFIIGITGYGHVSSGAQEMLAVLPVEEIFPGDIPELRASGGARDRLYKAVFKEEHLVEPVDEQSRFELQDYYDSPEKYRSTFHRYWPHMNVLINAIYWDHRYPRLITKEQLRAQTTSPVRPRLKAIGDISCDIGGAIEFTDRATDSDEPLYVYDPIHDSTITGIAGCGPVMMTVYNLPCEFPIEASKDFSHALTRFMPHMAAADYGSALQESGLPPELKRAVIVWKGTLAPDYKYLEKHFD